LAPGHAVIYLSTEEDDYELVASSSGQVGETARAVRFTAHDNLISRLQRDDKAIGTAPEQVADLDLAPDEQERLQGLDATLLVPLKLQEHLLGFLALGARAPDTPYTPDETVLLDTMARQAAIALGGARLNSRLSRQERDFIQHTRQLTHILALGDQLKSLDRDTVAESTVAVVHEGLGYGLVSLSLVEEDDPSRVRIAAWAGIERAAWERLRSTSFPLIAFGEIPHVERIGDCRFAYAPGTPPAVSAPGRPAPWCEGDQLYVLLTAEEGLLGYLTVDRPENGRRPTRRALEMLELVANQAAVATQNANLYATIDRALDERVAELATLQEIDRQTNVRLDLSHVTRITLEWAIRMTGAIAGTLAIVDRDRTALRVAAHSGYAQEMEEHWAVPWSIEDGLSGRAVRTCEPALVENIAAGANLAIEMMAPRSHLVVPIASEGQVVGVMGLESDEPSGFTVDHLTLLARLNDHAAVALGNVRVIQETEQRLTEARSELVRHWSTALREPLTSIRDRAAALQRGETGPETDDQRELADGILGDVGRATDLLAGLSGSAFVSRLSDS